MFTLTGMAHFVGGMRAELVDMVPPSLPNPGLLVTVTGLLELAGAAGLLIRRTAPWAAGCLTALLIVMFPANVYAAVEELSTGPFEALIPPHTPAGRLRVRDSRRRDLLPPEPCYGIALRSPLALSTRRCTPARTASSDPMIRTCFRARVIAVYSNSRVSSDDASPGRTTDTVSY